MLKLVCIFCLGFTRTDSLERQRKRPTNNYSYDSNFKKLPLCILWTTSPYQDSKKASRAPPKIQDRSYFSPVSLGPRTRSRWGMQPNTKGGGRWSRSSKRALEEMKNPSRIRGSSFRYWGRHDKNFLPIPVFSLVAHHFIYIYACHPTMCSMSFNFDHS